MRTSIRQLLRALSKFLRTGAPGLRALLAPCLFGASLLAAQTAAAPPASTATHSAPHHAKRSSKHVSSAATPAIPAPPAAPPAPNWPINDKPAPATVSWDSSGLRIDAANSSLHQILSDVATATGAKVEGMGSDERVYGDYGPGQVREVLSQLLQGSGYNILMIGDQAKGEPLQIVLSARHSGNEPATAKPPLQSDNDDDAAAEGEVDEQPQPVPIPPSARPGFGPGGPGAPVRTPQQVLEDMQRLQQSQPPTQANTPPNQ